MQPRRMFLWAALAALLPALSVSAHEWPGHLVVNGDVTAVLETADGPRQYSGRMNGYLTLSSESMENGARIEALNVALFGVDQRAMTGRTVRGKPTGVVGFSAVTGGDDGQRLRYDPQNRSLVGRVKGRVDMPQFYEMAELEIDTEDDLIEVPTMEATLEVRIGVGEIRMSEARAEPIETRMKAEMSLDAAESTVLGARSFDLAVRSEYLRAQLVFWPWIEIGRRLCVQPVRIFSFSFPFFFHLSGDGLAFGQPGNDTQWAKADVVFTYRDWITLFQSQYSTLTSDEVFDLLDEVDVDDCIEVYFVDRFSPQDMFGGGATAASGSASAKVVSSDENADFAVDLTHLAHEMGHVLGLPHPTPANISSTNTLMCPSGFNNDNPARNSQENKDNLSNPLLTFTIKLLTPGPDCNVSADCGPCP